MIELITFDLDNTLWDVGKVIGAAELKMRDHLAEVAPAALAQYTPELTGPRRQSIVAANPDIRHDLSALRTAVLEATIRAAGYGPAEAADLATAAFEVFMIGRHDVQYFDDALSVLEQLSGRYRMGALTNGNAAITRLGLDRFFEFALCSADVGASKPAPHMFEQALRQTGVAANRAVHVGDHLVDDIAGASAVGMHTVLVEIAEHPPIRPDAEPGQPTTRINAWRELPHRLAELVS